MLSQGPFSARDHYYRQAERTQLPLPQIRVKNYQQTALYPYSLSSDPRDTLETACFHHIPSVNHICDRYEDRIPESMGSGLHIVRTYDSKGIEPFGQEVGGTFDMSLSNGNRSSS